MQRTIGSLVAAMMALTIASCSGGDGLIGPDLDNPGAALSLDVTIDGPSLLDRVGLHRWTVRVWPSYSDLQYQWNVDDERGLEIISANGPVLEMMVHELDDREFQIGVRVHAADARAASDVQIVTLCATDELDACRTLDVIDPDDNRTPF